jgi:hypothetical protein
MITSRYEIYVIILLFIGGLAGAFYLGAYTTQQTINIASQQIYNQGLTTGKTLGLQQGEAQCNRAIQAIASNCMEWENPHLNYGYNITGTPTGTP